MSTGRGSIGAVNNVMVVPDLEDTLMSVSAWDKSGCYTLYGDRKVTIYDQNPLGGYGKALAIGYLELNGLYYFNDNEDFIIKSIDQALLTTRSKEYKQPPATSKLLIENLVSSDSDDEDTPTPTPIQTIDPVQESLNASR
jgi:hypothetical protein